MFSYCFCVGCFSWCTIDFPGNMIFEHILQRWKNMLLPMLALHAMHFHFQIKSFMHMWEAHGAYTSPSAFCLSTQCCSIDCLSICSSSGFHSQSFSKWLLHDACKTMRPFIETCATTVHTTSFLSAAMDQSQHGFDPWPRWLQVPNCSTKGGFGKEHWCLGAIFHLVKSPAGNMEITMTKTENGFQVPVLRNNAKVEPGTFLTLHCLEEEAKKGSQKRARGSWTSIYWKRPI